MDNNNTWGWIIGVIVVIVVIGGIWWYVSTNPNPAGTATTTNETATTTAATTTPVAVETRSSSTVAAVAASLADAGNFNSLLVSTGVAASLTGKGPYTLFIPTNEAYASLTSGTLANMTAAQKKRLAQYAVVSGKALDIDAVSSGTYTALSKDPLNFQVNLTYQEAFVNSGYAIREYKASNGIVYLISAVLVPPQTPNASTGSTGTPVPSY